MLDAIQGRGVRLAIDDFGTGYSSMSVTKRFTTDTIKIDRSFVRDLPQKSEDIPIARAIIEMGRALGLTVIAEGVEPTSLRRCISPSLWATELNVARVHLICADFTRPLRFERSVSLRLASLA